MVGLVQFPSQWRCWSRGRPSRGPLRTQARLADLPARPGTDGAISASAPAFQVDGIADFFGNGRARNRHQVCRESSRTVAALPLMGFRRVGCSARRLYPAARPQIATITGPALGGPGHAVAPGIPYGMMVVFRASGRYRPALIRLAQLAVVRDPATPADLFSGTSDFVRNKAAIPGNDLARSARSAAGRRATALCRLCARYPADRPLGPSHAPRPSAARS